MSVVSAQAVSRVLLTGVSWSTYEALVTESDRRGSRFTYLRGVLEILSPSREHEQVKTLLGRMIEMVTLEGRIAIASGGSTTLRSHRKQAGVEPDECYFVANEAKVRARDSFDAARDPPPDLAIEMDITSSFLDQLEIYSALGVPEVWLCDGRRVRVFVLGDEGSYSETARGFSFPFLPLSAMEAVLAGRGEVDETTPIHSFRESLAGLK